MFTGKVKWFNAAKGFGFIAPEDGSRDVFVHVSEVEKAGLRDLHEEDVVQFDTEDNKGKKAAVNIKLV
ncbi:cold-shock protein [Pseudomonadota bacterium]